MNDKQQKGDEEAPEREDGWEDLLVAGDAALRLTGRLFGRSVNRAVTLAKDTRKAFRQGKDPMIDDAIILDEDDGDEGEGQDDQR